MAKQIKIYTTNTCAYCNAVKQLLDSKGHKYEVINLDDQPEKREEMMQLTALMTVPVVAVTDDADASVMPKIVQGWNPGRLIEAVS
ncbi:MAG TPA: glutaredoxin [Candidatus Saccharimonadales bacterium]|nr:glutaredoxin [Candidatus Saccharimonadales bacterium]